MTKVPIKLPKLFALQSDFEADKTRFKVLCAGRRWGKTELVTFIICKALANKQHVSYYSMTYKSIKDVYESVLNRLEPIVRTKNATDMSLKLETGGKLTMWSAESGNAIRGRGYDLFIIDEASFIPDLYNKWVSQVLPMLADKKGSAIITSTPFGINDFYRLYQLGINEEPDWRSYRYPTSTSPFVDAEELANLKRLMPSRKFREEFEAEFIADEGAVFRGVENVTIAPTFDEAYEGVFVMGVDWGKMNDYTAISVWDAERKIEVQLDRFNQINWDLQRGRIVELARKWNVSKILAESNSIGEPNIEALATDGLPIVGFATTSASKTPLIDGFALAIEMGAVQIQPHEVGTMELNAYAMTRSSAGTFRYSAPTGGHDDTVIARALGYKACTHSLVSEAKVYKDNPFTVRR